MDKFADMQKSKEDEILSKEELVLEKRNERLQEMRERLRAKEKHAEQVRERRRLNKLRESQEEPINTEIPYQTENLL